jgi:hypothetical protein
MGARIGGTSVPRAMSTSELEQRAEHHAREAERLLEGRLGFITNIIKAGVHATLAGVLRVTSAARPLRRTLITRRRDGTRGGLVLPATLQRRKVHRRPAAGGAGTVLERVQFAVQLQALSSG